MKAFWPHLIVSVLFTLALTACGGGGNSNSDWAWAPVLDFECSFTDDPACAPFTAAGNTLIVGLSSEVNLDCRQIMQLNSGSTLYNEFDYLSFPEIVDMGTYVYAKTERWVMPNFMPVDMLPKTPMRVCAVIDLNGNATLDAGEPYHSSTYNVGDQFLPFSTWSSF